MSHLCPQMNDLQDAISAAAQRRATLHRPMSGVHRPAAGQTRRLPHLHARNVHRARGNEVDSRSAFNATRQLASSRLITSCAAIAALFVFMPMGERIVAAAFDGSKTGIDRTLVVAFLLNIALILFAWRRSKDLQNALSANEAAQRSAHDNAYIDHVTGLANRRELMRVLAESNATKADGKLLLLDLDFFKKVNDVHGHVVGDEVLRKV